MRLGDLDELIKKGTSTFDESIPIADFIDLADSIPAVDAVKVVRCKECKECRRYIDTDIIFCDRTEVEVSDDDFCSRGERVTE